VKFPRAKIITQEYFHLLFVIIKCPFSKMEEKFEMQEKEMMTRKIEESLSCLIKENSYV
jgi:hypothetical protein